MSDVPLFVFDESCVLCSATTRFVLRHEREHIIRFVGLHSEEGRALAARYDVDVDDPETFLFVEKGEAFAKSKGIIALARHLRWPAGAVGLIRFLPASIRDRLYVAIARNRYRLFGRMAHCMVPDAAMRQRFSLPDAP